MAGALFQVELVSPEKPLFRGEAFAVTAEAHDGEIGILPRHAPMVAALDTGLLRFRAGAGEEVVFVAGGFAEVRGETVRVVTEAGERPAEIDEERAHAAEQRARERLAQGRAQGEPIDLPRAEAALRRALVRLRAREMQFS